MGGWVALYSPTPAAYADTPTGERTILRATRAALALAGFRTVDVDALRTFDKAGDAALQDRPVVAAGQAASDLISAWRDDPPLLWYTYHSYYKAPDLVGPTVARALGIPYVLQQPSVSRRRLEGPHGVFAQAAFDAAAAADVLFWPTERDLDALIAQGWAAKLRHLPPSLAELPPRPVPRPAPPEPRFLTVARMQPGAKVESYRRLAATLLALPGAWSLTIAGSGPAKAEVRDLFAPLAPRVTFLGAQGEEQVARLYPQADLFLWPGHQEGVGMVYLEAQGSGVPVIAEDQAGRAAFVANRLARPGDPADAAALIAETLAHLPVRQAAARGRVEAFHSPQAAAAILRAHLEPLL